MLAAAGDLGFVDLDQAGERAAAGRRPCCGAAWRTAATPSCRSRERVGVAVAAPRCRWNGSPSDRPPRTKWQPAHSQVHALVCSAHALLLPQPGQAKPAGQRAANRYSTHAASSGKCCWNSIKERGKSVICVTEGHHVRDLFYHKPDPAPTTFCCPGCRGISLPARTVATECQRRLRIAQRRRQDQAANKSRPDVFGRRRAPEP